MRAALNFAHLGLALCITAGAATAQTTGTSGAGQSIAQASWGLSMAAAFASPAVGFIIAPAASGVGGAVAMRVGVAPAGTDVPRAGQRLPLEVAKETLLPQPDKEPRP